MRENKIEHKLKEGIEALGGMALKFVCTYFTGMPDRLVLLPGGRVFFVELKAPGKKPARRQPFVIALLTRLGFKVQVIDSLEGVREFIQSIQK